MPKGSLGEFEKVVLYAILQDGGESYGGGIIREIEERGGRTVSSGAIYVALRRLESKGLVVSRLGEPTPERGGRAKRYFQATPAALGLLRESRELLGRMSEGLDRVLAQ